MSEFKRNPFISYAAGGYVTAINILAVEYLIKEDNRETYSELCAKVNMLSEAELEDLDFQLNLNKHTSTLGAMITQGDYDEQRDILLEFLGVKTREDDESFPKGFSCVYFVENSKCTFEYRKNGCEKCEMKQKLGECPCDKAGYTSCSNVCDTCPYFEEEE